MQDLRKYYQGTIPPRVVVRVHFQEILGYLNLGFGLAHAKRKIEQKYGYKIPYSSMWEGFAREKKRLEKEKK